MSLVALWATKDMRSEDDGGVNDLSKRLLTAANAAAMEAHGGTDAAVLLPLYGWPD